MIAKSYHVAHTYTHTYTNTSSVVKHTHTHIRTLHWYMSVPPPPCILFLQPTHRIGVAIGDYVLDLSQVATLFNGPVLSTCKESLVKVCPVHTGLISLVAKDGASMHACVFVSYDFSIY